MLNLSCALSSPKEKEKISEKFVDFFLGVWQGLFRSVGTSLASQSSHLDKTFIDYLLSLSSGSLFSPFFCASGFFPPSCSPVSCACVYSEHGTAGEPGASRMSAGAGG